MVKAGSIIVVLMALMSVVFGIVYCTRGDIMPYHERFIGMSLEEISQTNSNLADLMLILMNVIGSGLIAFGILTIVVVYKGLWKGERWAWWAILITFLVLNVPQVVVTQQIGGTPVMLSVVGLIVFLIAMGLIARQIFVKRA